MPKTIEQYLEMGLDRKMAEYYASGKKKVTAVSALPDFTLLLTFNNGEQRILDMKPALETGGVFTIFRKYENFQRVYLDDCGDVSWDIDPNIDSNIVWNNKVDLCPDSCITFLHTITPAPIHTSLPIMHGCSYSFFL